jgi:hypothetical protein
MYIGTGMSKGDINNNNNNLLRTRDLKVFLGIACSKKGDIT